MSSFKLTYFDATGRAELTRLLFKLAGQPFEDVRVSREQWSELKATTSLRTVPILEVDGGSVVIPQSSCMERYVAQKFGLDGGSGPARLQVDIIHTTAMEYILLMLPMWHEKDETKKAELRREFLEEKLPVAMAFLTAELERGKAAFNAEGFFVGTTATMADLTVSLLSDVLVLAGMADEVMPKYPLLKALIERVKARLAEC